MSVNLNEALTITKMVDDVFKNRSNEDDLLKTFISNGPSMTTLLDNLVDATIAGFKKVVATIDDQTLIQEWSPINSTLNYVGDNLKAYQAALSTVEKATTGNNAGKYVITSDSQSILFEDWCNGGNGSTSAIKEMASWLNIGTINDGDYASLSGIFSSSGIGATDSIGSDALNTWKSIITSAQAYSNPSVMGDMYYDTQFNSVIKLMECTSKLVMGTYYVHDSALQLLELIGKNQNNYTSVYPVVKSQFGGCDLSSTIWHQFATTLDAWAGETQSFNTARVSAFVQGDYPSAAQGSAWAIRGWRKGEVYFSGVLDVTDTYPNGFVSALKFHRALPSGVSESDMIADNIGLQAIICEMKSDLDLKVIDDIYPNDDWYANPSLWNPTGIDNQFPKFISNYAINEAVSYENYYPAAPAPMDGNHVVVVTGFKFITMDCDIAISLKFSQLNLSTQEMTGSGTWVDPVYSGHSPIQAGCFDNMSGNYASGTFKPQIMSTAAWNQTTGEHGPDNTISTQMASMTYRADIFQPSMVKQIIS